ncbi:hypothetical protein HK096_008450, partial [Nowakowskiella sp. JEL0078]
MQETNLENLHPVSVARVTTPSFLDRSTPRKFPLTKINSDRSKQKDVLKPKIIQSKVSKLSQPIISHPHSLIPDKPRTTLALDT